MEFLKDLLSNTNPASLTPSSNEDPNLTALDMAWFRAGDLASEEIDRRAITAAS